ncbi:unnamed protein product [Rhodiola kirilowii]
MDKDKLASHGGGLLPPSGRFPSFSPAGNTFNMSSEASSSTLPPLGPGTAMDSSRFGHGMTSDSGRFSHDISQMPDNPPKKLGHRRAHSEILTLPDDINFDSDLGVVGVMDGPTFSDDTEEDLFSMYLDMEKFNSSSATSSFPTNEPMNTTTSVPATGTNQSLNAVGSSSERPRVRHQHSQSMDGSSTIKTEMLMSASEEASAADSKKAMSAAKLAELALIDPKRAKRIWANRQSAARSKERKMRYIAELERKVQALQTDATSMSAQLALLQRDTISLTAENSELKLRLQTMEQQVHLQDALNDALKEEIQHLKVLTGQTMPNGGSMMNYPSYGGNQPHYPTNQSMHTLMAAQQFQQLQIHSHKQQQQHHQFQQHQLLQRQQQQQQQLDQQQHAGDLKTRSTTPSSSQKDNSSELNSQAMKE